MFFDGKGLCASTGHGDNGGALGDCVCLAREFRRPETLCAGADNNVDTHIKQGSRGRFLSISIDGETPSILRSTISRNGSFNTVPTGFPCTAH